MTRTLLLFVVTLSLVAQTRNEPSARTTGPCSPITEGNSNTFNLTCQALTPGQQKVLEGLPALVNRLLEQREDLTALTEKLDACISVNAPRHVTAEQRRILRDALSPFHGETVIVRVFQTSREMIVFGEEFVSALREAGLDAREFPVTMSTQQPVASFELRVGANKRRVALGIEKSLVDSKLEPAGNVALVPAVDAPELLTLTVPYR